MMDLINREAAINAPIKMVSDGLDWVPVFHIKELPSAQPDVPDTNVGDMISRQAAIETVRKAQSIGQAHRMLLQLPSAQPGCEDAVSRFKVLRLIDYSSHDLNDAVDNRYMQNEIKQLPSVTPKQSEWIPCSERCPAHRVYVLVTYKSVYGIPDIGITWYSKSEGKWNTSREVRAWMPLPKPYEGERDDNT